jgi:phage-related protein
MAWTITFYQTRRGECPIASFLATLPEKARAKCITYLRMLEGEHRELPRSVAAKVSGDLWELRPEFGGVEYRFLYFTFIEDKVVVVHAITKKTQKLREQDIEMATSRVAEVRERYTHGRVDDASPIRERAD